MKTWTRSSGAGFFSFLVLLVLHWGQCFALSVGWARLPLLYSYFYFYIVFVVVRGIFVCSKEARVGRKVCVKIVVRL